MSDAPIQNLDSLDVIARRTDGGVTLVIVVSARLDDTDEHRTLLGEKINTYLWTLGHADFQAEFGTVRPATIRVACAVKPNPAVKAWIAEFAPTAREHGAELELSEP